MLCPATPPLLSPWAPRRACFLSLSSSPSVFFLQDLNIIILKQQKKPPNPPKTPSASAFEGLEGCTDEWQEHFFFFFF